MSTRSIRDAAIDLTRLPYLTRRRAAIVADCHPSQIARDLIPIGQRGRAYIYATEDVLAYAAGRLEPQTARDVRRQDAPAADHRPLAQIIPIRPHDQRNDD